MATRTITRVEVTDDIDGSPADRTVTFALNGSSYEIDLSKKNSVAFDKALKPYLSRARKVRAARSRGGSSAPAKRADLADIRRWAIGSGLSVSERGRVPASVIEAYDSRRR